MTVKEGGNTFNMSSSRIKPCCLSLCSWSMRVIFCHCQQRRPVTQIFPPSYPRCSGKDLPPFFLTQGFLPTFLLLIIFSLIVSEMCICSHIQADGFLKPTLNSYSVDHVTLQRCKWHFLNNLSLMGVVLSYGWICIRFY